MNEPKNVVTLATTFPLWFALIRKDTRWYGVAPLAEGAVTGVHKDFLGDAVLLLGKTEEDLHQAVQKAFPECVRGDMVATGSDLRKLP